ncbi:MAG: glucose 1-dehydrogenase [Deltaproteobacteria bacterium]|nr:glucose 1-dehydrogenase [Deltaproteobacteria bacterium]
MDATPFSLKHEVAIVTGGNGGIGRGIAEGFAAAGSHVVVVARNQAKIDKAVEEIQQHYNARVLGFSCDVTKQTDIKEMMKEVHQKLGKINILVNNAGMNIRKMPQDYMPEEWDRVIETNLRGPFLCCHAVYPFMKETGSGKIINIGSMTSIFGGAKLAPYGASKGAIVQLTKSLATAWAPDHIQVNAILPGWIDTDLTRQARKDIEGLNERVLERTPSGRWGVPSDLAGTAVFLASAASDFVTGVAIPVDGGFSTFL